MCDSLCVILCVLYVSESRGTSLSYACPSGHWVECNRRAALGTWGYGKVKGQWYEIYANFRCGKRTKLTACEVSSTKSSKTRCVVRGQCGPASKVRFISVWAIPHYPSSRGAYQKYPRRGVSEMQRRIMRNGPHTDMQALHYQTAPMHFVKQALKSMTSLTEQCATRCAWY